MSLLNLLDLFHVSLSFDISSIDKKRNLSIVLIFGQGNTFVILLEYQVSHDKE